MDLRKIKKLIEMLQESDLNEIEVKEGEESVRINRKKEAHISPSAPQVSISTPAPQQSVSPPAIEEEPTHELAKITSPMVGTFYRAAAPGEEPFVEVGNNVKVGQTICILEAMKLMNEIESEFNAEIVEILVENGTPVEFGQVLMRVKQS